MLCTSRQIRLPLSFDEYILFNSNTTKQPIQKYIDHQVLQMKTPSDNVLGLIVVRQVDRAVDGLWLYALLMLDEIEKNAQCCAHPTSSAKHPPWFTQLYTQLLRSKE